MVQNTVQIRTLDCVYSSVAVCAAATFVSAVPRPILPISSSSASAFVAAFHAASGAEPAFTAWTIEKRRKKKPAAVGELG
jgi:hypothetical protein